MKSISFLLASLGFLLGSQLVAQPTYLGITGVTTSPGSPGTTDQVTFHLTGYFSSTGISVQSVSVSNSPGQVSFIFQLNTPGMGLPVIVDFDTSITAGPFPVGVYQITVSGFGVSPLFPAGNPYFVVSDSLTNPCQALFSWGPDSGNWIPEVIPIAFSDQSVSGSPIVSWAWSFGDGGSSSLQNPSHGYDFMGPGNYLVCLTILTSDGCTDTWCDTVLSPVNPACQALFSGLNTTGNPFGYSFTDLSIGNSLSWFWDFGTGDNSTDQNPFYMFPGFGTYEVCLSIVSAEGCSSNYCTLIEIGGPDPCWGVFIATNPVIEPSSGPGVCDGSIEIAPTGGTPPYQIFWSIGQTGLSISGLCSGTYILSGYDAIGCVFSDSLFIGEFIDPCDTSDVIISFTSIDASCLQCSDGSLQIQWGGQPPYQFSWMPNIPTDPGALAPGNYALTITDSNGCQESIVFSINYPNGMNPVNSYPALILGTDREGFRIWANGAFRSGLRYELSDLLGRKLKQANLMDLPDSGGNILVPAGPLPSILRIFSSDGCQVSGIHPGR